MNETVKSWIIVALIIIVVALGVFTLYIYLRRRYTRERFAFFALTSMTALGLAILLPILSSQSIWGIAIHTLNHLFSLSIPFNEPTFAEQILAIIVFLFYSRFVFKIYSNWRDTNPISVQQFENEKRNKRTDIPYDFYTQLKSFFKENEKLQPYNKSADYTQEHLLGTHEYRKLPWHENVAEIFSLLSNQYKIDVDRDWYSEAKCLVSIYGKENDRIHIHCSKTGPSGLQLEEIIKFADSSKEKVAKVIIAVQENGKRETYSKGGYQIEKRHKDELLNGLVDLSTYTDYITKRYTEDEISLGTNLRFCDMYVPSSGVLKDEGVDLESVEDYILTWTSEKSSKQLAVLGEYGQGKSVLALKIAYELLKNPTGRIPILIELRGKSPRNLDSQEILAIWASSFRIAPQAILKLHQEGKILLIFEGFDEMDLVGDAGMRLNHFRSLWEFAKTKNSKVLITGRPNFFLDNIEEREALGIYKPLDTSNPYCSAISLNSFTVPQIKKALRNSLPNIREGILAFFDEKRDMNSSEERFYELISRPSTLFQVSSIWNEAKFSQRKANINAAIVIKEFIYSAFERQEAKKNDTPLTTREREYFMMGIAVGMADLNGYSNQLSKKQLNTLILNLYDHFPEDLSNISSVYSNERKPLKERFADPTNDEVVKDTILTDVRTCGILVKDQSRSDYFKFSHKSFMEYLISKYDTLLILNKDNPETFAAFAISKSIPNINISPFKRSEETTKFISQVIAGEYFQRSDLTNNEKALSILNLFCKTKFITPKIHSFFFHHALATFTALLIFMVGFVLLLLSLSLETPTVINDFGERPDGITYVILFPLIFLAFLLNFIYFFAKSERKKRRRRQSEDDKFTTSIRMWYLTCKELSIDEDYLNKFVYKKYLNKLKREISEK